MNELSTNLHFSLRRTFLRIKLLLRSAPDLRAFLFKELFKEGCDAIFTRGALVLGARIARC